MNAASIAESLLSGQVGNPFAAEAVGTPNVGPYYPGQVGDLVAVQPVYPGRVGLPAVEQAQAAQGQVAYSAPNYVAGDVTYLGFASTSIPAGSVGTTVSVQTQRPFTPQKMGCPSTVTGLLINQINISGTNLLANSLGIPIELFSEVSTFPQILWPTLDTAVGVDFVVQNPTGAALNFTGCFYGTQVRR
jgi:hypothetical protein